ncbi:MAG: HD domain-containing protein [Planctomycetaceae bacterium]|nr:HD domain-containing protein [Planctomycetaceae bacterium]
MTEPGSVVSLSDFGPGDTGECFVLLASRDQATTRDGKPYYRVNLRDAGRTVTVMVWNDSPWFSECEASWKPGQHFRIRGTYRETRYGPQFELDAIREAIPEDREDGFDPTAFFSASRFDTDRMAAELHHIASTEITDSAVRQLVLLILEQFDSQIRTMPAASRNHHAYRGGFLEHVLCVTKNALYLADRYCEHYPHLQPPLSKSLVLAGAILHDIGKMQELSFQPHGPDYTPAGRLVGHILLGRDIVRDAARQIEGFDPETLLRLEHIVISHQNLPEWGSPIAPHTPEALLVHYADDIDAKFHIMAAVLEAPPADDEQFSSQHNPLRRRLFRGL